VPIGVVSAVEARPKSLFAGEKCRGGGVSRESSLTACCGIYNKRCAPIEAIEETASRCFRGGGGTDSRLSLAGGLCKLCQLLLLWQPVTCSQWLVYDESEADIRIRMRVQFLGRGDV